MLAIIIARSNCNYLERQRLTTRTIVSQSIDFTNLSFFHIKVTDWLHRRYLLERQRRKHYTLQVFTEILYGNAAGLFSPTTPLSSPTPEYTHKKNNQNNPFGPVSLPSNSPLLHSRVINCYTPPGYRIFVSGEDGLRTFFVGRFLFVVYA